MARQSYDIGGTESRDPLAWSQVVGPSSVTLAEVAALARHANAMVTAQVYAGITEQGREVAAAKLVEAGFGR